MKLRYLTILMAFLLPALSGITSQGEYLVVPVEGTIDGGIAEFVERAIDAAEFTGNDGIIFRIDTPGGRIDSAVRIKDMILSTDVPTIAFVDKNAISAGSLISIACDRIYMSTGASIGAATAVDLEGKKASEKVISYFRAQMRATAEANGRRADIAEAMVDETIVIDGVTTEGQLVTLTYREAFNLGFADGIAENISQVLAEHGDPSAAWETVHLNWAENIVRFLTDPTISSLLMTLGFLGLLLEIRTPGWGLGGTIALVALALFFGSHYIVRLAGMGEILLFTVGVILLLLEILVIPGFGIAGVAGIGIILASMYLSLVGRMPLTSDLISAAYSLAMTFIVSAVGGILLIRYLPGIPLFRRIALEETTSAALGYTSSPDYSALLGKPGTALSDLRPAGKADIDGHRLDVVTEGSYIGNGQPVEVIEVRGSRIVVTERKRNDS